MSEKRRLPPILAIDDERNMRLSLQQMLSDEGYDVDVAESAEEGLTKIKTTTFLMVIVDARLEGMSGYEFLSNCHRNWPDLPVVMITAYATPQLAIQAIKGGAIDYLSKPFAPEEILHVASRCADRYKALGAESDVLSVMVGRTPMMERLRGLIRVAARVESTVLILGESGTGKELAAGAIHTLSKAKAKGYVRINCAAIPEELIESELFGHEKGAFTGANTRKLGRVEKADQGTLFLDEIGAAGPSFQAKMLRFLENKTFTRVGGHEEITVGARIIAATNQDLGEAIEKRQFRGDLYYRLNVFTLSCPPLRHHLEDLEVLIPFLLKRISDAQRRAPPDIARGAAQILSQYNYPGNVRELKNILERALVLSDGARIKAEHIELGQNICPDGNRSGLTAPPNEAESSLNLKEIIQETASRALVKADGNVSAAAKLMGVHRLKLHRILAGMNLPSRR